MPRGAQILKRKLVVRLLAPAVAMAGIFVFIPDSDAAVIPKPGATCSKLGQKITYKKVTYTCIKSGKKLVWNKGVKVTTSKPAPVPTKPQLTVYTGGEGKPEGSSDFVTPELGFTLQSAPAGTNVKLFLYDPTNTSRSVNSPGIFLKSASSDWKFYGSNTDGSLYLQLPDGEYSIDTVEPSGSNVEYIRKFYVLQVSDLKATVDGVRSNSLGVIGLTLDLPNSTDVTFSPVNQCQLRGQDGNLAMNVGFPAREDRLTRQGKIRAIIIPVDFSDAPGTGKPAELYYDMAMGTNTFYKSASANRVSFDFQILPNFVRMPFAASKYKLGNWSQGDAEGYWRAVLEAADSKVDYSKFDVVYVVSPPSIPWSAIAYGPAFPKSYLTNDGPVKNGTFSGADAYQNFPGAGWKWMAHETGHLFGLHDLYTVEPMQPTFGSWEIMSLNWTTRSIELSTWNRFILDWLETNQYECFGSSEVVASPKTLDLIPVGSNAAGKKAVFIRLSDSLMLVAEYRATAGLDVISNSESGLLVYTVDMKINSLQGGWKVIRPSRSTSATFEDSALQVGESVEIQGVKLTVLGKTSSNLQVRIN